MWSSWLYWYFLIEKWAYGVAKLALETFKSGYYRIVINLLLREYMFCHGLCPYALL